MLNPLRAFWLIGWQHGSLYEDESPMRQLQKQDFAKMFSLILVHGSGFL